MAHKSNKKPNTSEIELPECQVCMETMTIPIYQCETGHSLCNTCTKKLSPPICPICRQKMTQMRNLALEDIINKAKIACPNSKAGCSYTRTTAEMEDHVKECIFRDMDCPLGAVFGRCSWTGKTIHLMSHFKDRHESHCNINCDSDVILNNISVKNDDRHVFLVPQGKLLFLLTFKLDTIQNMAYWAIQHIGSKSVARQHIYEIHVTSNQDDRRKVVYIEHCFNDTLKADEVFRIGKCGVLPLSCLEHFIRDKKVTFRFFIKRLPNPPKNNDGDSGDGNGPKNNGPKSNNGPKGPKPHGPPGKGSKANTASKGNK